MNGHTRRAFALVGLAVGLVILEQARRFPELRYGLIWAVDSWIHPPDAEAQWEQDHASRRPS